MSRVHQASINPTKLQIAQQWLGTCDWFDGDVDSLQSGRRFSYRFDDPDGEVGVESILISSGDQVMQLPLTYRASELAGAEQWFLTTMEHSALGQRWIYFGLGDPVMVNALVTAIRTGQHQEDYQLEVGDEIQHHDAVVKVHGTGSSESSESVEILGHEHNESTTVVHTSGGDLVIPHVLGTMGLGGRDGIVGQWPDGPADTVLAVLGSGREQR